MIEEFIQFGALGILGYVVAILLNKTNTALYGLKGAIEKNTNVIEYCLKPKK